MEYLDKQIFRLYFYLALVFFVETPETGFINGGSTGGIDGICAAKRQ